MKEKKSRHRRFSGLPRRRSGYFGLSSGGHGFHTAVFSTRCNVDRVRGNHSGDSGLLPRRPQARDCGCLPLDRRADLRSRCQSRACSWLGADRSGGKPTEGMTTSAHSRPETSILILLRSLFLKSSLSSQGGETAVDVSLLSSWRLSYPCLPWLRVAAARGSTTLKSTLKKRTD